MTLSKSHLLTALLVSALPLLTGQQTCSDPETCFFTEPAKFSSVEELECGIGPDGINYCHWSLQFDAGQFTWFHSDVGETGTYTCDESTVTGKTSYATYSGEYDATTGLLYWEGVAYQ